MMRGLNVGCEINPNNTATEAVSNGAFTFGNAHCGLHEGDIEVSGVLRGKDYFMFDIPTNVPSGNFTVILSTTATVNNGVQLQLRDGPPLTTTLLFYATTVPYTISWPAVPGHRYYVYIYTATPDNTKSYQLYVLLPAPALTQNALEVSFVAAPLGVPTKVLQNFCELSPSTVKLGCRRPAAQ